MHGRMNRVGGELERAPWFQDVLGVCHLPSPFQNRSWTFNLSVAAAVSRPEHHQQQHHAFGGTTTRYSGQTSYRFRYPLSSPYSRTVPERRFRIPSC